MRLQIAFAFFIASLTTPLATADVTIRSLWTLNDVSILLPLPSDMENNTLIKASDQGAAGVMLPRSAFKDVPSLSFFSPDEDYEMLRAIAFRIDPCFPGTENGAPACRAQIRVVWQPVVSIPEGSAPNTIDAGIHSFYELTHAEFDRLLTELSDLKGRHAATAGSEGPLGVHPIAAAQGLTGPYVTGLHRILLRYMGEKRLSRFTFMLVRGPSILWSFGGFDVAANGAVTPLAIARIDDATTNQRQSFFNRSPGGLDFVKSGIAPAALGKDTFNLLMSESVDIKPEIHESEIIENLNSIYRLENPDFHTPDSADCVSCHVAQSARMFALKAFPEISAKADASAFAFKSDLDLTNTSTVRSNTRNMRAFGYFGRQPAVSQRTINESAAVVKALSEARR